MPSSWSATCWPSTSRREAGGVFDAAIVEERAGFVSVLFEGKGARKLFANEAGGHRFQRVPPTEKRGRVQTSTVTVAVLHPEPAHTFKLNMQDVDIRTSRGSGPGGQHRNKTDSCVTLTHLPTGAVVRVDMRSQHESKRIAFEILAAKLADGHLEAAQAERNEARRAQLGCGARGDKIRTYREQDDRVTDHRTDRTWKYSKWIRGDWD